MNSVALRQELEACHGKSFSWALNCCERDHRMAEEVLQTAYLKVLEGRARFDGHSAFTTWLFAVIRRTASEARRGRALLAFQLVPLEAGDTIVTNAPGPDEDAQHGERRAVLAGVLHRLSRRQREVLLLVFYHDHTVEEAAAVMDIGVGSARTHYARGKQRLRELLSGTEILDD